MPIDYTYDQSAFAGGGGGIPAYSATGGRGRPSAAPNMPSGASQAQPRSAMGNLIRTAIKMYAAGGFGGGGESAVGAGEASGGMAAQRAGETGEAGIAKQSPGALMTGASTESRPIGPAPGTFGGPGGGITGLGPGRSDSGLLGFGGRRGYGANPNAQSMEQWWQNLIGQKNQAEKDNGYAPSKPAQASMDWVSSFFPGAARGVDPDAP